MALSSERKQQNNTVISVFVLALVTVLIIALLVLTNYFFGPKIVDLNMDKIKNSMVSVMPEGTSFEDITTSVTDVWTEEVPILNVSAVKDKKANLIGYCFEIAPQGYSGKIEMMVGINLDGEIAGIDIISSADTFGLGSKIEENAFKKQFVGKSKGFTLTKGTTVSRDEVLIISGATYSTKGFYDGAQAALTAYKLITEEAV